MPALQEQAEDRQCLRAQSVVNSRGGARLALSLWAVARDHGQLLCAELAARGLDAWVKNWVQTPRITQETVLPSFRQGASGNLWPRSG